MTLAQEVAKRLGLKAPPHRAQPILDAEELRDAVIEHLGRAAGHRRRIELPLASAIAAQTSKAEELARALAETSPVLSGRLAASWINGESTVTYDAATDTYWLDSSVPYARINDLGGETGKGGAVHIAPSYYVASAAARVGLRPEQVQWVAGPLRGER